MSVASLIALFGAAMPVSVAAAPPAPIACESLTQARVANGRVLSAGNGGLGGTIPYPAMAASVKAGYAAAAAIDQWVETGKKPLSIEVAHITAGVVDRTRPLCAYPATARYNGTGSTDDSRNFHCR